MALVINTNFSALNAQRNLNQVQTSLERTVQRLSTGLRINSAADDAAGLAISERLTAQIRGLNQATRNANDGISVLQTADGSLQEVSNLLQRARELAVQSANDATSASDRQSLNAEVSQVLAELDRLANTVQFNGKKLLDGTFVNQQFQVGANAYQTISFSITSVQTDDLGARIRQGNAMSSTAFSSLSAVSINGISINLSGKTTIDEIVNAINTQTGTTKVTAFKNPQTIVVDTAGTGIVTGATNTLTINGIAITLTTGNAGTVSDFISTVNSFSNQTGVTVSTSSAGIVYTRASGGDISFLESSGFNTVGDAVANSSARTFNAGLTLSVDLGDSLTVGTSATALAIGFATSLSNEDKQVNALNITTASGANDAIQTIDFALNRLNKVRGDIGALQNRFSSTVASLQVAAENLSAARSRIRDADVAKETAELTRTQILVQAGVAVLAQANQLPSVALSLLGR